MVSSSSISGSFHGNIHVFILFSGCFIFLFSWVIFIILFFDILFIFKKPFNHLRIYLSLSTYPLLSLSLSFSLSFLSLYLSIYLSIYLSMFSLFFHFFFFFFLSSFAILFFDLVDVIFSGIFLLGLTLSILHDDYLHTHTHTPSHLDRQIIFFCYCFFPECVSRENHLLFYHMRNLDFRGRRYLFRTIKKIYLSPRRYASAKE